MPAEPIAEQVAGEDPAIAANSAHAKTLATPSPPEGSADLADADQVARGIAEGAVADAVRLVDRLLDDLGVAGLQPFEGPVDVIGGQVDAGVGALGHHLRDRPALVVGDAGDGINYDNADIAAPQLTCAS